MQRVALILLLSFLWLVHWGSSAVLHENAQAGHWWVFKTMLGQVAQEMELMVGSRIVKSLIERVGLTLCLSVRALGMEKTHTENN